MANERSEEQQEKDYEKLRQGFIDTFSFAAHNEISPPLAAFCALELVVDMLRHTSPDKQTYKDLMVQLWEDLVDVEAKGCKCSFQPNKKQGEITNA
jgi:hypothetical protein